MAKCVRICYLEETDNSELLTDINKILASGAKVGYEPNGDGVWMFFDAEVTAEGIQEAWLDYMERPDPLPRQRTIKVAKDVGSPVREHWLIEDQTITAIWPDKQGTYPFLPHKDYPEPDNGDNLMGESEPDFSPLKCKVGVITEVRSGEIKVSLESEYRADNDELTDRELRNVIPRGFDGLWEHLEHVKWIFRQAMDAVWSETEARATRPVDFTWEMRAEAIDNTRDAIQGMLFGS